MNSIGFVISHKNSERRRALLPEDLSKIINKQQLFFETGYGMSIGIPDNAYINVGANIVSREVALTQDIICDVKLGDADYIDALSDNKILFGWAHAIQGLDFTSLVLNHNHTVIAWEEIFEDGRYVLYKNREVAGEAAMMQAFQYCGKMPYDCRVAILGNGQTAKGALRVLHGLGADVDIYPKKLETLFKKIMFEYDVIVNCVMWDTSRTDRIIYREDLKRFHPGTMIVDVSCDSNLEIETSHPTTIDNPVYYVDGILHYSVDNTPAMYPGTVSKYLSEGIVKYIDMIVSMRLDDYPISLKNAVVINEGHIVDNRIRSFREARHYFCK